MKHSRAILWPVGVVFILAALACSTVSTVAPTPIIYIWTPTPNLPIAQPTAEQSVQSFEAQVRYILADAQLGGVIDYYRQFLDQPAVAEAVRRWDSGVRVTNIDMFERRIIGDRGWQVVYVGTDALIDGMAVRLSTDDTGRISTPIPTLGVDSRGLLAYYPFNGNANDESGNGNHGTVYGATRTQDRFGYANSAYWFGGSDSHIDFPGVTSNLPNGSIALWFRPDGWANIGRDGIYVFAGEYGGTVGDGVNLGTHPYYASDGALLFGVYELHQDLSGIWHWANSGVRLQPDQWYFLVGTWGIDGIKLYINGSLAGTDPYSGPAPNASYSRAGASHWPNTNVVGTIDDIRIYSRALSSEEVQNLYGVP